MEVTIRTAQTAEVIGDTMIYGSSPRACPSIIWVPPYTHVAHGSEVSSEELKNGLSDYVNGLILRHFDAPSGFVEDLAFHGTHLWLADRETEKVYRLDPNTGEVLGHFDAPASYPEGLAFDGTHLWVACYRSYKLDTIYKVKRR
jgi:hypothetical protein